jgi:hypothetical protein
MEAHRIHRANEGKRVETLTSAGSNAHVYKTLDCSKLAVANGLVCRRGVKRIEDAHNTKCMRASRIVSAKITSTNVGDAGTFSFPHSLRIGVLMRAFDMPLLRCRYAAIAFLHVS